MRDLCGMLLLVMAAFWDGWKHRIPNGLIGAGFILGLLLQILESGGRGFIESGVLLLTSALGLFVLFHWSVIGAGDLKLISVMSLFMNKGEFGRWLIAAVFCGGLLGIGYRIAGKKAVPFAIALCLGRLYCFMVQRG